MRCRNRDGNFPKPKNYSHSRKSSSAANPVGSGSLRARRKCWHNLCSRHETMQTLGLSRPLICGPTAGGSPRGLMGNFHNVLAEVKEQIRLEVAHVLFIDVVGYSKVSINEQRTVVDELTTIVRDSDQYQKAEAAGRLIKIPTGDGMALVFYTTQEAPAQCAVEISRARKEHPRLELRMGVHSGPVSGVIDVNGHANLAGAGLNIAQRVMDCGDAGHIMLSKRVAEDLAEYEQWRPLLHDLGTCEVKHGVSVAIVNLHADEVGNAKLPRKFETLRK